MTNRRISLIAAILALTIAARAQSPTDLPVVSPESVGFSSQRLENLHALMQQAVDQKQIAGMVTILARHGKVVDYRTYGDRDLASATPMTKDTIFRDYSMTKPVTGVAMMILYEQGKWLPSIPSPSSFRNSRTSRSSTASMPMANRSSSIPIHPPTMHELMTHTAGFTYGFFGDTPVDKMYQRGAPVRLRQPAGVDRQTGQAAPALSARQRLDLLHVDGYRGLHRREALRPVASRIHSRKHL